MAISLFIQAALFVLTVFLFRHHQDYFSPSAMPAFWLVLTLIGFAGGCVGLAVSASAKKEIQAVWALPFIAILALFLSKPVLESNGGDKPSGALLAIEHAMPTFYTQECLNQEIKRYRIGNSDMNERASARKHFFILAVSYPVVFLLLAFWLQNRLEKQWDGR
jgi:ABC-type multidrug transport system permease subunit